MANPIKETPVLNGEDAENFYANMEKAESQTVPSVEIARMKENFEAFRMAAYVGEQYSGSLIEHLNKALNDLVNLYEDDEGCRNLPQYKNAIAALEAYKSFFKP